MFDQIPTLADVCSAIAEGRLTATSDVEGKGYNLRDLLFHSWNRQGDMVFLPNRLVGMGLRPAKN